MFNSPVAELTHFCNISVKRCTKILEREIDYYDFTFVLEGSMVYIVNGQRVILEKNDAIFLPPGTLREREASENAVAYVSFNFIAHPDITFPFDVYMRKCITEPLRKLVSVFPGAHLAGINYAQEKCTSMLNYILFELLDTAAYASDDVHINEIMRYIDTNIGERLTLKDISAHIKLSKEYTCTLFKRKTGKTITEYIIERKLYIAQAYILAGEIPLNEISALLGFDNYNYFSRRFKRQFDLTPMEYKKKCK